MKKKGQLITAVKENSIARELGIEAGDRLLSIDGAEIEDVFDYDYRMDAESVLLLLEKADGELWELDIEHDYEDIGLVFDGGIMSDYKCCTNHCIFCFIDQMPAGMRDTLYFKDDDSRLSFLQGNYITLTNMKDRDVDRIIEQRLAPINISVHTTNPKLREYMLGNRFAGRALGILKKFYDAGIPMNGQLVLCPGINDGAELDRTIKDLSELMPHMQSLCAVPVGISKFREGLARLEAFDKDSAAAVIDLIERWQKELLKKKGSRFVYASDELYLLAGRDLPEDEAYEGYPQLENGVGMLRLLTTQIDEVLKEKKRELPAKRHVTIATGAAAYPFIQKEAGKLCGYFHGLKVDVRCIKNNFFGESITVSGLITGKDLLEQMVGTDISDELIIPVNMLKSGEELFLDDVTVSDVSKALGVPVRICESDGQSFVETAIGESGRVICASEKECTDE